MFGYVAENSSDSLDFVLQDREGLSEARPPRSIGAQPRNI